MSELLSKCEQYLNYFCVTIPERPVGSSGNRAATVRFQEISESFGWEVEKTSFSAMDWEEDGADLIVGEERFLVFPSQYSLGCDCTSELVAADSIEKLRSLDCSGKILLIHSGLASEQLMPKNFVFFNPEEHQQIIALLEDKEPTAIITATGHNASLAGGLYPFPLIEDGDFQIPSVYMTEEEGQRLLREVGRVIHLISRARRIPAESDQLLAKKIGYANKRIVVSAHIDAKKGTPGAIDNGTGVVILLLVSEMLSSYEGRSTIELVPFNGEDYYAASGQMLFVKANQGHWQDITLNINIDGAGYHKSKTVLSQFNLPEPLKSDVDSLINRNPNLEEGFPWVQGDHSIFIQQGVPAVVFSSQWLIENFDNQDITHTPKDHVGIVDCQKVVDIAQYIKEILLLI
jgi:aminopeptidase YwaD